MSEKNITKNNGYLRIESIYNNAHIKRAPNYTAIDASGILLGVRIGQREYKAIDSRFTELRTQREQSFNEHVYTVSYHDKPIITFYSNGLVKIHAGLRFTPGLVKRLAYFMPSNLALFQHRGKKASGEKYNRFLAAMLNKPNSSPLSCGFDSVEIGADYDAYFINGVYISSDIALSAINGESVNECAAMLARNGFADDCIQRCTCDNEERLSEFFECNCPITDVIFIDSELRALFASEIDSDDYAVLIEYSDFGDDYRIMSESDYAEYVESYSPEESESDDSESEGLINPYGDETQTRRAGSRLFDEIDGDGRKFYHLVLSGESDWDTVKDLAPLAAKESGFVFMRYVPDSAEITEIWASDTAQSYNWGEWDTVYLAYSASIYNDFMARGIFRAGQLRRIPEVIEFGTRSYSDWQLIEGLAETAVKISGYFFARIENGKITELWANMLPESKRPDNDVQFTRVWRKLG